MKQLKSRFVIGIGLGILLGSLVALLFGNVLTGVLGGCLAAMVSAYAATVNWRSFGALCLEAISQSVHTVGAVLGSAGGSFRHEVVNLASKTSRVITQLKQMSLAQLAFDAVLLVVFAVGFSVFMVLMTLSLIYEALIGCVIWPIWFIARQVVFDQGVRKALYYLISVLTMSSAISILAAVNLFGFMTCIPEYPSGVPVLPPIFIVIAPFLGLYGVVRSVLFLLSLLSFLREKAAEAQKSDDWMFGAKRQTPPVIWEWLCSFGWRSDSEENSWLFDGCRDGRPPLRSLVYMFSVRTLNVLAMFLVPILFCGYLLRLLGKTEARFAAYVSGLVTLGHLGTCYHYGWINSGNPNFWLSTALAIVVGVIVGHWLFSLSDYVPTKVFYQFEHLRSHSSAA